MSCETLREALEPVLRGAPNETVIRALLDEACAQLASVGDWMRLDPDVGLYACGTGGQPCFSGVEI